MRAILSNSTYALFTKVGKLIIHLFLGKLNVSEPAKACQMCLIKT